MRCRCLPLWLMFFFAANLVTEGTIIPNLRCIISFLQLKYDAQNYDRYPVYYRNESVMQIAQTGHYDGPDAIEEYMKATDPRFSPYLIDLKLTSPRYRSNGYNRTTGLCEFFASYKMRFTFDPNITSVQPFDVVSMGKIYYHLKAKYITRVNLYFTPDEIRLVTDVVLNNDRIRSYICSQIYFDACGSIVNTTSTPSPTECESRLAALPTTEGTGHYIDGNVKGCRFLHAIFAKHNPTMHCPHMSLEPMADPKGNIKCHTSKAISVSELFTATDFKRYNDYAKRVNIDPVKGHNSPY